MPDVSAAAFDPTTFDSAIRPADDLFRHVNGPWLEHTEIPSDLPGTGAFLVLRENAEEAVRDIITTTDVPRIADLYASFMAEDRVDSLAATPIADELGWADQLTSAADLPEIFARLTAAGLGSIHSLDVDADPGDPSRYVLFLAQAGIGLPDEEYYRLEQYAEIRAQYLAHIERSLALAGVADPAAQAQLVFDLETRLAGLHWDKVRTRDIRAMYTLQTVADFDAAAPALRIADQLARIGADQVGEIVNCQPSFFSGLGDLLTDAELPAWQAWTRWRVVTGRSPYLSGDFVAERFGFYGTVLSGTPELKQRWKRGVELVERVLGEEVGRVYVDRHFPAIAKERMDTLVRHLVEAYRQSITDLDWMTADTKAEALRKLDNFTPKVGYPDEWRDYSALEVDAEDLIGNVRRAAAFHLADDLSKVGGPIRAHEWLMTPQTVNAYYHPLRNEIVFPAAILQPPFFDVSADDALNYGGIGAVIGHEIGHGFDDQGSTCDGEGRLRDWWTAEDRAAFEARTSALIAQYDALSPAEAPELHVNGSLTIGENIGDLGGLSIALKALRIAEAERGGADEPIDSLTPDQRLFLNWGLIWQTKLRAEAVRQRIATDPHSPAEFRCNQIVRNIDAFHRAFDVTETDPMWLPEEDRVCIW